MYILYLLTSPHETVSVTDFRSNASELLGRVRHANERVIIQKNGKAAAALISFEELKYFERLEDKLDLLLATEAEAAAAARGEKPIPWSEAKARLGL